MAIVALALEHGAQSSPSCRLLGERDGRAWSFDETLIPEIKPAPRGAYCIIPRIQREFGRHDAAGLGEL